MPSGVTLRQLFGASLLACATAAVFGAKPLADWVDGSIVAGTVVQDAADGWLALTQKAGLERPYDLLRAAIRQAENAP